MEELIQLRAWVVAPAAIGGIVDAILLKRQRGRIHDLLTDAFVKVDDFTFAALHRPIARWYVRYLSPRRGNIAYFVLGSLSLTFLAIAWSRVYAFRPLLNVPENYLTILHYGFWNLVFDVATLYTTGAIMRRVQHATWWAAVPLILLDCAAAVALGGLYVFGNGLIGSKYGSVSRGLEFLFVWPHLPESILVGDVILNTGSSLVFFTSLTVLIPTLVFLSFTLMLTLLKMVVEGAKLLLRQMLEKGAEVEATELMPFTILGGFISLLLISLELLRALLP